MTGTFEIEDNDLATVLQKRRQIGLLLCAGLLLLLVSGWTVNRNIVGGSILPRLSGGNSHHGQQRPLHVYILAGQSNMIGFASQWHMRALLEQQDAKRNRYAHLYDADLDRWNVRENVFVVNNGHPLGKLTMGQGFNATLFGPELGFGWALSEAEPDVDHLLIKTAYNGMSLHVCFRPPSVPLGNYTNFRKLPVPENRYGECYRNMLHTINTTLQNLTYMIPEYLYEKLLEGEDDMEEEEFVLPKYEFKGFVWYQGWSDREPQPLSEYSDLLAHMLRDVRTHLETPELAVVIGGSGQYARKGKDKVRMKLLTEAQESITRLPDFVKSSAYVPTAHFFNMNDTRGYGVGYHYKGHADFMYDAGEAFGQAMLKLLRRHK